MEETLRSHLMGSLPALGERLDWGLRPQGSVLPAITLTLISRVRDQTFRGRSGLARARVQIDCWETSYGAAKMLARTVVTASDTLNSWAGGPFLGAFIDSERDDVGDAQPAPIFRTSLDFVVWHTET
jgi:hypothetical protein